MTILETQSCWIVGYGNRQRRDDGIGPYIVEKLKGALQYRKEVHLLAPLQLGIDLVEALREAKRILFVDATIDDLEGGWKWCRLRPKGRNLPYLTHHVDPAFLLLLLKKLYSCNAVAWLVSIHGSDFGYGEGLSPEAFRTADRVCMEILKFTQTSGFIRQRN